MKYFMIASWTANAVCTLAPKATALVLIQFAAILGMIVSGAVLGCRELRWYRKMRFETEVLRLAGNLLEREMECQQTKFDRLELASRN